MKPCLLQFSQFFQHHLKDPCLLFILLCEFLFILSNTFDWIEISIIMKHIKRADNLSTVMNSSFGRYQKENLLLYLFLCNFKNNVQPSCQFGIFSKRGPRTKRNKQLSIISRTILLSVISLLNEPNTSSPANVDASVMYRKWKESGGKNDEYARLVR